MHELIWLVVAYDATGDDFIVGTGNNVDEATEDLKNAIYRDATGMVSEMERRGILPTQKGPELIKTVCECWTIVGKFPVNSVKQPQRDGDFTLDDVTPE